jgi:hypothetical protein
MRIDAQGRLRRALANCRPSFAAVGEGFRFNGVNGCNEVRAVVPQSRESELVGENVRSDTASEYVHLPWSINTS